MFRYEKCQSIIVDGSSAKSRDRYQYFVVQRLDQIMQTGTGRALLKAIFETGQQKSKDITIIPYEGDDDNAYAMPLDGIAGRDASPAGSPLYQGGEDDPKTPDYDEREQADLIWHGTGLGSSVALHYNPEFTDGVPACPRDGKTTVGPCKLLLGAADEKDDQLLHELVHAMREMRGQMSLVPTQNKQWENEEEFFAILVTNIYVSEKGQKILRATHHDMSRLDPDLSTSEKFLAKGGTNLSRDQLEVRRLVAKLISQDWGMCCSIAQSVVKAEFNPIREYFRNGDSYPFNPSAVYGGNGKGK
jgi:hypothetical protein